MKSEKIEFENKEGLKISAIINLPPNQKPKAFALFAHCFTCNKNLKSVNHISRAFNNEGFGVMRFDFTGLGESEGSFSETNFSSNINDLIDAAEYLNKNYESPSVLIGHSLGGAAVLKAAHEIKSTKAVCTLAAPSNPAHVIKNFSSKLEEIKKEGKAEVNLAGRKFTIKKQFLDDLEENGLKNQIRKLKKPILLMHAPGDNTVGVENAREIFEAAMHPKSFISLDKADHLLSDEEDARYAGKVAAEWATKYINLPKPNRLKTDKLVVARNDDEDVYTTDLFANGHRLTADEPEDVGGNNYGPSPYDLLASSLASCTAMTMRMYANRKKWDLQEVRVHVDHFKSHDEDCRKCEEKGAQIDNLERLIEIKGNLDNKQRKRLIEIANKCPVHRTLEGKIKISTNLKD